jgi:AraC-like DNA-binding protein
LDRARTIYGCAALWRELNALWLSCDYCRQIVVAGTGASLTSRDEPIALKLSSRSFDGPDKDEAFYELYGREILKVDIEPLRDEPVEVEILLRALPGLAIATASASPILCSHTTMMIDNDDPVIVVNQNGFATYKQNGHETSVGPGDAVLTTNGLAGTALSHTARRMVNWRVSRALIAPLVANFDEAIGKPIGQGNPALPFFLSYLDVLNDPPSLADPGLRRAVVTHMLDLGALMLGARADAAEVANKRGVLAARMRSIKAYILSHLGRPELTATTVATQHGISTSYVRKLFKAEGTSFTDFVLAHRLAAAYRMLTDLRFIDRSISRIAHDAGFNDISHFNRSFRRVYGASPTDVQREAPHRL